MAVKKTPAATTAAKKSTSKAIVSWEAELAAQAEVAATQEASSATGQFFSMKSGVLAWNDSPLPGNEMAVVIVDGILENVFYEGAYDPDVPQGPTCFAFGRDEKEMAPHIIVSDAGQAQSLEGCASCEHNEFGSATVGKGKACRNTRRLAMIPAGTINARTGEVELFEEESHFINAAIGFMKLPVTSVKGYASYVKQIAGTLKRPPHGVFTRVSVVPDQKTQFKVTFEAIENCSNDIMSAVMDRHNEAKSVIDFPYQLDDGEQAPPPKRGAKKPAGKTAAAKKPTRRY